jgi:hypothetical protein
MLAFPSPIWFALVWMAAIFCMFLAAHPLMMATLVVVEEDVHMTPQRLRWAPQNLVGAWLHHSPMLALVHHRSNSTVPEFLQILLRTSFLGCGRTFSYNPSILFFPSPAQEVLPLTNLLSPRKKS